MTRSTFRLSLIAGRTYMTRPRLSVVPKRPLPREMMRKLNARRKQWDALHARISKVLKVSLKAIEEAEPPLCVLRLPPDRPPFGGGMGARVVEVNVVDAVAKRKQKKVRA
jgi:hypothetical protein